MIPPYLSQLLADGTDVASENGPLQLTIETLGTLHLPSGQIVGCDAIDPGNLPFARRVQPGDYPVIITGVRLQDGDEFIAAACLRFIDAPPVRWVNAYWKGQIGLVNRRPAYAVDSSIGAFMSLEAGEILADLDDLNELVYGAIEADPEKSAAMLPVPGADHLNAAIFSTGFGDGVYGSFWGLDANDQPVCLLTDYHIAGFTDPAENIPWWQFWRRRSS